MEFVYEETGNGYLVTLSYSQQKLLSGGVNGGVNELLEFIRLNSNLRSSELSQRLSMPKRTLERKLKNLKETSQIEFRGHPKTGGYFVIERKEQ